MSDVYRVQVDVEGKERAQRLADYLASLIEHSSPDLEVLVIPLDE